MRGLIADWMLFYGEGPDHSGWSDNFKQTSLDL